MNQTVSAQEKVLNRCLAGECGKPGERLSEVYMTKNPGRCIMVHTDCYNESVAARKAQLAAAPRCEFEGCNHR